MNNPIPIILVGGGGHCKSVLQIVNRMGLSIAGIIEKDNAQLSYSLGVPVIGFDKDLKNFPGKDFGALVTVGSTGDNSKRANLFEILTQLNFGLPTLISDKALFSPTAKAGKGSIVMDGAIVNADVIIGDNCIVNSGAIVEHDSIVGNHVHIASGAVICGGVKLANGAFLGAGCTVIQGVVVGEWAVVAAGAVVTHDIPARMKAAGVPAQAISGRG